jgi:hypothetical protein
MNLTGSNDLSTMFVNFSREKLIGQYWPRLRACVESLSDEQVWWRPNPSSNSIGNLMLHLNGNVTQWLISSFNGTEDERDRPTEFSRTEGIGRDTLLAMLSATMERASDVLGRVGEAELRAQFAIQGYHNTGLEVIYQVVEHFGLHYGQIAYIAKMLRDVDLGFYRELNQTGRLPPDAVARP